MTRFCSECGSEQRFEQPPCPDAHAECPEWACTGCGAALVGGWLSVDAPAPAATRRHLAA